MLRRSGTGFEDLFSNGGGGGSDEDPRDPALRPISDLNFDELRVREPAGICDFLWLALLGNPVRPSSRIDGIKTGLSLVPGHQTFLRVELD